MDKDRSTGRIAVIGERELVLGFRLIGMESAYEVNQSNDVETFNRLYRSEKYSLLLASEKIKARLEKKLLDHIEVATTPLVLFIPMPGGHDEESVGKLAKRILGVDIGT
jgi:V/A-type H+-transporting ATPase subunit F